MEIVDSEKYLLYSNSLQIDDPWCQQFTNKNFLQIIWHSECIFPFKDYFLWQRYLAAYLVSRFSFFIIDRAPILFWMTMCGPKDYVSGLPPSSDGQRCKDIAE